MNRWMLLFLLLVPPIVAAGEEAATATRIDSGLIAGELVGEKRDVRAYRGIPYAAAPVGDLRWRPPTPADPWDGVKKCVSFGPAAPQPKQFGRVGGHTGNQSENCLYLNVWAPAAKSETPLPVMVWIHGGGMVIGAGSLPFYNGEAFARRGVVLVTINYRLGPFGFFGHPLLSAERKENISGNYGLLDQVAALRWVKRNAHAFGGDASRVTIFGESAGGVSVGCLMVSPLAKGLFHRAILQSGTANGISMPLRTDRPGVDWLGGRGIAMAKKLGVEGAAGLRALTTEQVMAAARPSPVTIDKVRKFGPVVDGDVLPAAPSILWRAGRQHDVPVMIGANAQDGGVFSSAVPVRQVAGYRWLAKLVFKEDAADVIEAFPAEQSAGVANAIRDVMTVGAFVAPARRYARWMEKVGSPCWYYHFSRVSPRAAKMGAGAAHGFEIPYVFGNLYPWLGTTEDDARLSRAMQDCWVRFAATGNPNAEGTAKWPAYTTENDTHIDFGDRIRVGRGLLAEKCDLFDRIGARKTPESPAEPLVRLPVSKTVGDAKAIAGPILRATVTADRKLYVGGERVHGKGLERALALHAERKRDLEHPMQPSECVVILRLDRAVTWDRARALLAACEAPEVRIYRVYLAVIPPKGGDEGVFGVFRPVAPGIVKRRLGRSYPSATVGALVEMRTDGPTPVPLESLEWRLRNGSAAWKARPTWLSPDAGAPVEEVVAVLDLLARSGAPGVVFPKTPPPGAGPLRGVVLNGEPVDSPADTAVSRPGDRADGSPSAGFDRAPDWGGVLLPDRPARERGTNLPRLRFHAPRDYPDRSLTLHVGSSGRDDATRTKLYRRRLLTFTGKNRDETEHRETGRIVLRADVSTPWRRVSDLMVAALTPEIGIEDLGFAFEPVRGLREGLFHFMLTSTDPRRSAPWKPEAGRRPRIVLRGGGDVTCLAPALAAAGPEVLPARPAWVLVEEDVRLSRVLSVVEILVASGCREVIFAFPVKANGEDGVWLNGRRLAPSAGGETEEQPLLNVDRIDVDVRRELTPAHFGR